MATKIYKNYSDFLERENIKENGVSEEFALEYPNYEVDNITNEGCWNCRYCSSCRYCSDKNKNKGDLEASIPTLENIHQRILEAVSVPEALDMGDWHTCDITHCRAGWVVHLAGEQGYELEELTSTLFAAMQIYKKSSEIKVSPTRFFETNEVAMEDIKRCAELEKNNRRVGE